MHGTEIAGIKLIFSPILAYGYIALSCKSDAILDEYHRESINGR
jgi:hypothetical protein